METRYSLAIYEITSVEALAVLLTGQEGRELKNTLKD